MGGKRTRLGVDIGVLGVDLGSGDNIPGDLLPRFLEYLDGRSTIPLLRISVAFVNWGRRTNTSGWILPRVVAEKVKIGSSWCGS